VLCQTYGKATENYQRGSVQYVEGDETEQGLALFGNRVRFKEAMGFEPEDQVTPDFTSLCWYKAVTSVLGKTMRQAGFERGVGP